MVMKRITKIFFKLTFMIIFAPKSLYAYGSMEWRRTFYTKYGSNLFPTGVAILPDGKIIVVADEELPPNLANVYILGLEKDGGKIWDESIEHKGRCEASDVDILPDNNIVIVGGIYREQDVENENLYVLKINPEGKMVWEKTFNKYNVASAVSVLPDGNILAAGETHSFGAEQNDTYYPYAIIIDQNGQKIWEGVFEKDTGGRVDAIAVLPDGNLIFVGESGAYWVRGQGIFIIKMKLR